MKYYSKFLLLMVIVAFTRVTILPAVDLNPCLIGKCALATEQAPFPIPIVVDGDSAYVAEGTHLKIINIANPVHPLQIANFAISAAAYDLVVWKQHAYIAEYDA